MKIWNTAFALLLASFLFIGCKDKVTTAEKGKEIAATKENKVAAKPAKVTVNIEGMSCAIGCAKAIEEKLSHLNGVQNATVDFDEKLATVNFDAAVLSSEDILATIEGAADGKTYKAKEVKKG
jgi:mercuric ion binding protein